MVTTITASDAAPLDLDILDKAAGQFATNSPVRSLLDHLHDALSTGKTATLVEQDAELSPNEAAKIIGVSRPFLLRFMKAGALRYTMTGAHQRITLTDLLEFNERRLSAGKFAAEATAKPSSNESSTLDVIAPVSDDALKDLDEL